ncbi:MAG: replication protein RepA [Methylococcaceae bacterium]|nr:replication protein RepA [Methylococcaceae bacterium]
MEKKPEVAQIDFRSPKPTPAWVREAIETHLAIEAEDAKSAGTLGFMARALVIATMPYKDPKIDVFTRVNGDFRLRIIAGSEKGIPYGIYPRLLLSWVSTEAVRTQSPAIELGESLSVFLKDVLDLKSDGGGKRGSGKAVSDQMQRTFGAMITAQYTGSQAHKGFNLKNVMIADELELEPGGLWTPQSANEAGTWKSQVLLTNNFYKELIDCPVPLDLRAYLALRGSPLAMDIYSWLTYRYSYTNRRTKPIRWEALMMQFGSNFTGEYAVKNFKTGFLQALKAVEVVYPRANFEINDTGMVLLPSAPHVAKEARIALPGQPKQDRLF